jgi:hypothetical protein
VREKNSSQKSVYPKQTYLSVYPEQTYLSVYPKQTYLSVYPKPTYLSVYPEQIYLSVYPEQTYLLERKVLLTTLALYPPAINDQTALSARKPELSLECKMPYLAVETSF